jgi:RHS repeat-associated protein
MHRTQPPAVQCRCHLGSTSIAANGTTGAWYAEQRYKPWGEQRYPTGASTLPTRRQYTGQINDLEMGLYFYNAHYYSSALSRFLSADTIVPDGKNPQAFNRYAYVGNRPLNLIDPTGHRGCKPGQKSSACPTGQPPKQKRQGTLPENNSSPDNFTPPAERGNGEWAYKLFLGYPDYFAGLRISPEIWDRVGSCNDFPCLAVYDFRRYVENELRSFPDMVLADYLETVYGLEFAQAITTQVKRNVLASMGQGSQGLDAQLPLTPLAAAIIVRLREGVNVQLGFTVSELASLGAPGPGFAWMGSGPVGTGKGAWYNAALDVQLRPDLSNPAHPPHWDYLQPGKVGWRIWGNGSMDRK